VVLKPSDEERRVFSSAPTLQPQNYLIGSDFDSVHARVHAFVLSPGEYDFWLYSPTTRDPSIGKRVVRLNAGEIVYGGEIWVEGCSNAKVSIRNQWKRDKPIVESRFPLLPLDQVQERLFE
jgi:hypothetical protein